MKPRFLTLALALFLAPFSGVSQIVSPAPAPLAVVADDSAWQVIPQHLLDPTQPPSADDPRWLPLARIAVATTSSPILASPASACGFKLASRSKLRPPPTTPSLSPLPTP